MQIRSGFVGIGVLSILLGSFDASAVTRANEPVPSEVSVRLDRLRTQWPEVPRAQMRSGSRMEFRDGSIQIGRDALRDLVADPANADGVVLTFLLAHEGWHSVQYARRSAAEVQQMKDNQMLECEADFMGAAVAYRTIAAPNRSPDAIAASRRALLRYLRAHTADLSDGGSAYPPVDVRAMAIAVGWA